jgi:hypothetical protein
LLLFRISKGYSVIFVFNNHFKKIRNLSFQSSHFLNFFSRFFNSRLVSISLLSPFAPRLVSPLLVPLSQFPFLTPSTLRPFDSRLVSPLLVPLSQFPFLTPSTLRPSPCPLVSISLSHPFDPSPLRPSPCLPSPCPLSPCPPFHNPAHFLPFFPVPLSKTDLCSSTILILPSACRRNCPIIQFCSTSSPFERRISASFFFRNGIFESI